METFGKNYNKIEKDKNVSTLVSNGSVDFRGKVADKQTTGGWKASPFIIVNKMAERLAFYAIAVSMGSYLVREMHQSLPSAATHVSNWSGSAFVLSFLGAFVADAYLGRFKTIIVFSFVYSMGMVLLTLSAAIDSLRPPACTAKPCIEANAGQNEFLFCAFALIAIGTGGIKPCVSAFGGDQYDEADEKEVQLKYGFFNWFFFGINMGALLSITVIVYLQEQKGWVVGFGIPTAFMFFSIIVLASGLPYYRYQKPMGSPITRFLQVIVASVKNHFNGVHVERETDLYEVKTKESAILGARKLPHTSQYRFFDKAAVITGPEIMNYSCWKLCTVTQVEELKSFVRVLPIWATTIALAISFAQLSTFFLNQAAIMNRNLGLGSNFTIPTGSISVFASVNAIVLVPIYEKLIVPLLRKYTGHRHGITSLQRMGVGLFLSTIALALAALIEKKRRDESSQPFSMSVFWLFPQFFLVGSAEVFTYVGQMEFFYSEATDGTRSISSATFLSTIGIGNWLSGAIVKIVEHTTGGEEKGWLRNDLNQSKLDYYYWVLMGINGFNFLLYIWAALCYKGKGISMSVRDEATVELELGEPNKKDDDN